MLAQDIPMEIIGYALTTSIGRKAVFFGGLYFAGGLMITTLGLPAVLLSGAAVMLL